MADSCVDQTARDKASEAMHGLNNHIQVTTIKMDSIEKKLDMGNAETNTKVDEIKSAIKWAGGLIISLMLTVLGWAVLQQINANDSQKKEMAQQIEILQQQERARVDARNEILSRLPAASAAESAATANSLGQQGDLRDMRPNNGGKN